MIENEKQFENFVHGIKFDDTPDPNHRDKLEQDLLGALTKAAPRQKNLSLKIWRTIMKSPITKLAAAAVIIIAVLVGMHHYGGSIDGASVAWANISQYILDANSAIFKIELGPPGHSAPPIEMIAARTMLRQKHAGGVDTVVDYEQGKALILDSNRKTAMFLEISGFPEAPPNFFERLQAGVEKLKQAPDAVVESLGSRKINGIDATGIRVYIQQGLNMTIWSEEHSNLPVLVEIENFMGQTRAVMSDFQFDAEINESLFSMEIPEGYSQQEQVQMDLANPTEQDLIHGLRTWAEMTDGTFPPKLDLGIMQRQGPMFDKKFAEMNASDAEQIKMVEKIVRGLTFVQKVKGGWHYAGEYVKLGDAETAIFWYRPKDSETYRVIYGDLTVEDVAPEDLPE